MRRAVSQLATTAPLAPPPSLPPPRLTAIHHATPPHSHSPPPPSLQQHIATLTLDPSSPPTPLPIERADGTTEEACALLPCAATWTDQQITFFPHPYPTIR